MTDTPHVAGTTDRTDDCQPFDFDFAKLVAEIDDSEVDSAIPHKVQEIIEHIAQHVREENPDLDPREIARVLITATTITSALGMSNRAWTAIGIVNLFSAIGALLWHEADQQPEPDPETASRWWAVWTLDGRIRAVEEFDSTHTMRWVAEKLSAHSDVPMGRLEPIDENRAEELRALTAANVKQLH